MKLADIPYKVRVNGCIVEETSTDKGGVNNEILFRVVYSENMIEHALSVAMFEWLAQEMKIVVSTHDPKFEPDKDVDYDTLYLWHSAWSGSGMSKDAKLAAEQAEAAMGRFGGRWRGVSAGGATVIEVLQHLDPKPSFGAMTEAEEKRSMRGY